MSGAAKRHVRVLAGGLGPGAGSHLYNRELILRLAARGHTVSVVCLGGAKHVAADRVTAHELAVPEFAHWPVVWPWATRLRAGAVDRRFRRLALDPPDVVVAPEHLLLQPHARRFPDVPWVYLPHSVTVDDEILRYGLPPRMEPRTLRVYRNVQRWALDAATRTGRLTERGCGILTREYPEARPRFFVNPPGVAVPETAHAVGVGSGGKGAGAADAATAPADVRLLSVGALFPRKGVRRLLDALVTLHDDGVRNWTLDVVGDGPLRGELERRIASHGLADRVRLHGFVDRPAAFYERADLFVFPSRLETLGFVLLEAMGHGVPGLALRPDDGEVRTVSDEIIDSGRNGWLVEGPEEFRAALRAAIVDPGTLTPLGLAARKDVEDRFSWDLHVDRWEALFAELTGTSQA